MIIVDTALEERRRAGNPIRVAMVGAGFMGRGIALQILSAVPGMRLVAIANRNIEKAHRAYAEAGAEDVVEITDEAGLEEALGADRYAVTHDPLLLARHPQVEALIEVTGAVEHGARAVSTAIEHGKHVILMNAELDGTVGPILRQKADAAGVVYTNADGDQPGVQLNLYRFVKTIGVKPVLCGNIKGLHDPYRTRRRRRASPNSGVRTPAWSPPSPTGRRSRSSRRSSPTRRACESPGEGCTGPQSRRARTSTRRASFSRSKSSPTVRESSTTWSAPSRAPACSCSGATTIRCSSTTSTSTSWARGRCTASTRRGTSVTSRCRSLSREPCSSGTPRSPRSDHRSSRWSRRPRSISRPGRRSTR